MTLLPDVCLQDINQHVLDYIQMDGLKLFLSSMNVFPMAFK